MVTNAPGICLTPEQREALRHVANCHSLALDAVIATIQRANPHAFHTPASLAMRVFVDQPLQDLPCRGFLRFPQG
ncbi:hypothetical protein [Cupriavidus necator]